MEDRHDYDESTGASSTMKGSRGTGIARPGVDGSVPGVESAERLIRDFLGFLGENPDREGLVRTPERVVRAFRFLTEGYRQDVETLFNDAYFTEEYDEMVLVKDIEFYSLCEHHLLPFFGKVHVAYLPRRKIVGLSKIPRLVDFFARRLQVQERMTKEIAGMMMERLDPLGVGVVIEARHLCMVMRGVEKQHSTMTTSHMLGNFRDHQPTRLEFMNLISSAGP
jgi:GTP cyclohydrolase I